MEINLIELFAGVGSQAMALRNLGVPFKHHRVVEFDRFAIASYNAIHGTDFPTHDITEISSEGLGIEEGKLYWMFYSFPCQDLSVADQGGRYVRTTDVACTLLARDYKGFNTYGMNGVIETSRMGGLYDTAKKRHQAGSVWDKERFSPTIDTMQGGSRQPCVIEEGFVERKYKEFVESNSYISQRDLTHITVKKYLRLFPLSLHNVAQPHPQPQS